MLLGIVWIYPILVRACVFPSYLQSGDGYGTEIMREWHWHIMAGHHESAHAYSYVITFREKIMSVSVRGAENKKRKQKPFTRECLQEMKPGKYIAIHRDAGQRREKYVCIEFLRRSDVVVQLKVSKLKNNPDPTLCWEGKLKLDPWPLINRIDIFKAHVDCSFTGGYNMKIYDKTEREGICDTFEGETRLESECMEGEGMFFRYRHENCIPKGIHMHVNQRVYCIANWQDGPYTMSIVRHDRSNHQWCFRHPTQYGRQFVAILFKNVYCDPDDYPASSLNYLELAVTHDVARPLSSLCMDDFEACNMWSNPCKHAGSVMHLTCAKTCQICRDSRPATCTLPGRFHGRWLDTSSPGRPEQIVHVTDMFVSVQGFSQMQCIKWQDGYSYGEPDYAEQMLVTTFENGCRPRYQCVQLQKRNPSILRYKLSQSQIWPFTDTSGYVVDCKSFTYRDDDAPLRDRLRTRHFKTLISMSERIYVSCDLDHILEFTVTFDDGTRCNGTLEQPPTTSRTKMVMHLPRCKSQDEVQTFGCLDSNNHGYLGDRMIVTESQDASSELLCWLFPVAPGDLFYLLPASSCNEGAKDKISALQLTPKAIFHKHAQPAVIMDTKVRHKTSDKDQSHVGSKTQNVLEAQEDDARNDNYDDKGDGVRDNETIGKRVEEKSEGQFQRDKAPRSSDNRSASWHSCPPYLVLIICSSFLVGLADLLV